MNIDTTTIQNTQIYDSSTDTLSPLVGPNRLRTRAMVQWLSSRRTSPDEPNVEWGSFAHGAAAVLLSLYGGDCLVPELNSGDICLGVLSNREISLPIIEFDDVEIISTDCQLPLSIDSTINAIGPGSFPDRNRLPDDYTRPAQWENTGDEPEWDPAKYRARLAVEQFYGPRDADTQSS